MTGHLTVVTFNLFHDLPTCRRLDERLSLLAHAIAAEQPDLIALQEVARAGVCGDVGDKLGSMLAKEYRGSATPYQLFYAPADFSGEGEWRFDEGLALLISHENGATSKPEMIKFNAQVRLSTTLGGQSYRLPDDRIAVRMRQRLIGDLELDFYATHLTDRAERVDGEPVRLRQARELIEWIEATNDPRIPAVVAGDLNDTPDSATLEAFSRAGFIDVYQRAGAPPGHTNDRADLNLELPAATHNQRIDYLLLRPGASSLEIANAGLFLDRPHRHGDGWLWASDHIGVMARLNF